MFCKTVWFRLAKNFITNKYIELGFTYQISEYTTKLLQSNLHIISIGINQ